MFDLLCVRMFSSFDIINASLQPHLGWFHLPGVLKKLLGTN